MMKSRFFKLHFNNIFGMKCIFTIFCYMLIVEKKAIQLYLYKSNPCARFLIREYLKNNNNTRNGTVYNDYIK